MKFDPVKVAAALRAGLSAVCASCPKYWTARDRGLPGDQCLAVGRCGSPLAGDVFSEYSGPLAGGLSKFCFVCGDKSLYGVRVPGKAGAVGICGAHFPMLDQLQAVGRDGSIPLFEVRSSTGFVEPEKPSSKPTLGQAIAEVEAYYAKKDESS